MASHVEDDRVGAAGGGGGEEPSIERLTACRHKGDVVGIVQQLKLHLDGSAEPDPEMTATALVSLRKLVYGAGRRTVGEQDGGIEAILRALTIHEDNPAVMTITLDLLYYLADDIQNAVKIVAGNGLESAIKCLAKYPRNDGVQISACMMIWTLAGVPATAERAASCGIIDALKKASVRNAFKLKARKVKGKERDASEKNPFRFRCRAAERALERLQIAMALLPDKEDK